MEFKKYGHRIEVQVCPECESFQDYTCILGQPLIKTFFQKCPSYVKKPEKKQTTFSSWYDALKDDGVI